MEKCALLIKHTKENYFFFSKIFAYFALTITEVEMQVLHSWHLKTTGCFRKLIFLKVEPCINYGVGIKIRIKILNMQLYKKTK